MLAIHWLALREDRILALIPIHAMLPAQLENQIRLLADFDAIKVHHLAAS